MILAIAMSNEKLLREQALAEAFSQFNQLSETLVESYRNLEQRVQQLTLELADAHSERLSELAEKERLANRLENLLEVLPGGVIVVDGHGIVKESNPVARDFIGVHLIGRAWSALLYEQFQHVENDLELKHTNGKVYSLTRRSLDGEPGEILLLQDVTESRALRDRLERKNRLASMGAMIAGLAHQIRTPLASVLLYVGHLEQDRLDERRRRNVIVKIKNRVIHLESMVADMLQFVRGNQGEFLLCQAQQLIEEIIDWVQPQVISQNASLNVRWMDEDLKDSQMLCQRPNLVSAVSNLILNAIQANPKDLKIELTLNRYKQNFFEIGVEDNGPGIAPENREKVFDPFYTTRSQGTGLGLAVVRSVAEAHQGDVVLDEGEYWGGAHFMVRIPFVKPS